MQEVPGARVAQEDRLVLVCRSLGYLLYLAPRGGLVDQPLAHLLVPEGHQEHTIHTAGAFYVTNTGSTRGTDSPRVLVYQGFQVSQETRPPPCLLSLPSRPGWLSPPAATGENR